MAFWETEKDILGRNVDPFGNTALTTAITGQAPRGTPPEVVRNIQATNVAANTAMKDRYETTGESSYGVMVGPDWKHPGKNCSFNGGDLPFIEFYKKLLNPDEGIWIVRKVKALTLIAMSLISIPGCCLWYILCVYNIYRILGCLSDEYAFSTKDWYILTYVCLGIVIKWGVKESEFLNSQINKTLITTLFVYYGAPSAVFLFFMCLALLQRWSA